MEENIRIRKRSAYSKMERRSFPFVIAFLAFPVLHVLVFYFYTSFSTIILGLQSPETGGFTLDNIKMVFNGFIENKDPILNQKIGTMFGKSMLIWIISTAIGPLGWVMTYMLTKYLPGGNIFRALYTIPGIVGAVVFSTIMKDFYAYDGLITMFIKNLGVGVPIQVIREGLLGYEGTAFLTLLTQHVIFNLAGGGVILAGAFMRVPEELFESAHIDGCGLWREIVSIAIPCVWTTLSTIMVFSFCTFFVSDLDFFVYSNGTGMFGMQSMGYYMYRLRIEIAMHPTTEWYYTYMSALGMFITLITIPVVFLGKWILEKINSGVEY